MASEKKLSNLISMLNISAKVLAVRYLRQDISDVTFEVDGQIFHAHSSVLAERSPVFKALVEANKECIKIQDMNYEVFRALLCYIYTDIVEAADTDTNLTQRLLEAANRYALDALRITCEERLRKNVTLDTVLSSLALAIQLNCDELLDACLDFIASIEILDLLKLTSRQEYFDIMTNYPHVSAKLIKIASDSFIYENEISKFPEAKSEWTSNFQEIPMHIAESEWTSGFQEIPMHIAESEWTSSFQEIPMHITESEWTSRFQEIPMHIVNNL